MIKATDFLEYFARVHSECGRDIPPEIQEFCDWLKGQSVTEKPLITESGIEILKYLQANDKMQSAKEIAEGMGISSKKITGAIRKLVLDGYVSKMGQSPVSYSLEDKGRNFNIDNI